MGTERIIPQPANCGLGDLHYVIERVMNVYQPVFPLFIYNCVVKLFIVANAKWRIRVQLGFGVAIKKICPLASQQKGIRSVFIV